MASTAKYTTVEEASPSPPPLPNEPLPGAPIDVPITALGEGEDSDDGGEEGENAEEVWDPSSEAQPGEDRKGKGKRKAEDVEEGQGGGREKSMDAKENPWQAVWAPEQNGEFILTP
jgi:hypothetical protein